MGDPTRQRPVAPSGSPSAQRPVEIRAASKRTFARLDGGTETIELEIIDTVMVSTPEAAVEANYLLHVALAAAVDQRVKERQA